jgi:hypothetical protein
MPHLPGKLLAKVFYSDFIIVSRALTFENLCHVSGRNGVTRDRKFLFFVSRATSPWSFQPNVLTCAGMEEEEEVVVVVVEEEGNRPL